MEGNYSVQIEQFAERHFTKNFEKKYKTHWEFTRRAIIAELERIDTLLLTDKAETICDVEGVKIVKTKFKIAGSKESAKTSGHRCVVAWYASTQSVAVLLVYSKTDFRSKNETVEWKKLVKENYPAYREMISI